jgi:hypothetical protein
VTKKGNILRILKLENVRLIVSLLVGTNLDEKWSTQINTRKTSDILSDITRKTVINSKVSSFITGSS